jgi:eukaryotic-like serine/threonine-protein kinase
MASTRTQEMAQYSPDGKVIVYVAWASGNGEIWVCDSDGSHPLQLTHLGGPAPRFPRWSPDGLQVVFFANSRRQFDVYLISAHVGQLKQLTNSPYNEEGPSFSRDGKWVYFGSNRSGEYQVWKVPAAGGEATQVTQKGVFFPQESTDGTILFYLKGDSKGADEYISELWKVPVGGDEESRVLEKVYEYSFEVRPGGIFYASGPRSILYYDIAGGQKTRQIATLQKTIQSGFTVSPDEQWMLYPYVQDMQSDLMLVENFR